MNVDVQEPKVVLEVMFTVRSAEGTRTRDKTGITDDASGYVASLVRVEVNTARTVCAKHHCAILLATTRVDAATIPEKCTNTMPASDASTFPRPFASSTLAFTRAGS